MERYGSRLVCLRHSGVSVPDAIVSNVLPCPRGDAPTSTPERISLELSDGAREIDEDEWTDRNFLASETSGAGGLRYGNTNIPPDTRKLNLGLCYLYEKL